MFLELFKILKKPRGFIVATLSFLVIFAGSVLLPSIGLISRIIGSNATFSEKTQVVWSLVGSIQTNFTTLSAITTVVTALLFGIIFAIIVSKVVEQKELLQKNGITTGTLGLVSGVFGIGCAACGSLLISTLGLGGILTMLPFRGQEFGILGVLLLFYSLYLLLKKNKDMQVCEVNN